MSSLTSFTSGIAVPLKIDSFDVQLCKYNDRQSFFHYFKQRFL